jgi:hypothetical protein
MAISTYAELQTTIGSWSHADDLTAQTPDFIALCEARLNDMLLMKDMESEEDLTLTQGQNYVAIPSGFVSPIALWLIVDTQRVLLRHVLPEHLPYDTSATQPSLWAIDGANIRFDCPASEAYSAKFRMVKKSNLSESNTTNALLTRRPDIYLAGSMVEVARYTRDVELFNTWEPKFLKATAELKAAEGRSRSVTLQTDLPVSRRSNILTGE